ncbi:hypothetical protein [Rhodospirillum sp. A1_3_36]|uniref:hypothetical protein n=1 Tax=Rhodospirillum sp. A1_3_36 TaxID=3391666 RepID=UPI0039A516C7
MTARLHISGPQAERLAADVVAVLEEVLGTPPERLPRPASAGIRRGDPIAIAALVLAIPGAVVATLDLAARAKLAERLGRLLTRLRETAGPEDHLTLVSGGEPPLDLFTADLDRILDRLEDRPP